MPVLVLVLARRLTTAVALALGLLATLLVPVAGPAAGHTDTAQRIAYIGHVDGLSEVWTMLPDGRDRKRVTVGGATKKCDPAFSPGGREIAYAANDGGVYVVAAAGGEPVRVNVLPSDPAYDWTRSASRRPTWVDQDTLVFHLGVGARPDGLHDGTFDLWVVTRSADGTWSPMRQLTSVPAGAQAIHVQASNDGSALVYSYRPTSTAATSLYATDTAALLGAASPVAMPFGSRLGTAGSAAVLASWSPSGTQVAYVSSCSGGVQVMPVARAADGTWSSRASRAVSPSGGCGLDWSTHSEKLITYADGSRVYTLDLVKGRKAVTVGTGSQPGW